ncbi:wall-associated receptor kinase-like 8 [Juglans microcarpa x Juglans regia]|uniref:wall-associated receptor kinase-like 8 n=1 Tax=Juglans microcarpa x Juglans regia TaxID=2249226 RepID=UPI001B7E66D6|nr:wall-associated receptor kinase-like 8 [Juglans microcarpa x Juglans regia]
MAAVLLRLGFQIIILLSRSVYAFAQAANITKSPSCPEECSGNNVSIPYPFGIGDGCYISKWFEIVCNETDTFDGKSKIPVIRQFNLEVLEILLDDNKVRVNYPVFTSCTNNESTTFKVELAGSPFVFSSSDNYFVAMGCNNSAVMWSEDEKVSTGAVCRSPCDHQRSSRNGKISCKDTADCCVTSIPSDVHSFTTKIEPRAHSEEVVGESCRHAFLVENSWPLWEKFKISTPNAYFPVVLDWGIDNPSKTSLPIDLSVANDWTSVPLICHRGYYPSFNRGFTYSCWCNTGFHGNPYLPEGCQDIDECANSDYNYCGETRCENTLGSFKCIPARRSARLAIIIGISASLGLVVMLIGGWWSYKAVNKRKMMKQKEKFFKRNGGLLLQQQVSSNEINVQTTKLFDSKELEKATDRFNANRMLGQGGQGTVYKGMLLDGSIVAIKKSKIIDERKLEEFINEVVILSRINHRNVVKLLGCCLETEVPLLVYEFIPNGTLSQYLNNQNEEFPPTWDMRLQIATDIAGALFYLHSAASSPIYHRDIKSTNILLDEKYRAKLADFGTSRSVAIDQTHLTTQVQGTFGYLDPEYFQTSQFTEKSDVYSFGVVLVELLTGEKAISSIRTEDTKGLASYFIRSMEENNLFDILDDRVLKEGEKEVVLVANLAKRCLNLSGKKRPMMKEISMELVSVQTSRKASNLDQQKYEKAEYVRTEMYDQWVGSTSTTLTSCVDSGDHGHLLTISS